MIFSPHLVWLTLFFEERLKSMNGATSTSRDFNYINRGLKNFQKIKTYEHLYELLESDIHSPPFLQERELHRP